METATTTASHPGTGARDAGVGEASRHPLPVLVERVRARFGAELPPVLWSMSDDDVAKLLVDLQGLAAQVDAALLAAVREADRRDLGRTAGATSTASWVSGLLRIRPGHASRKVKLARDLDTTLILTQSMVNTGEISVEHADVIAQTLRDLPSEAGPDVRYEVEQAMLDHARVFHPKDLAKIGATILEIVDPELADRVLAKKLADHEARELRRRELSISDDPYSTSSFLRGKLDAETTELLRVALEPLAKPRPTTADGPDMRTSAQRMGDGFHELLRRYLGSRQSPTHAGEKPHLVITVTDANLINAPATHPCSTPAPRSPLVPPNAWRAMPRSASGAPSTANRSSPTAPASSPARPVDCWSYETAAAHSPVATDRRRGATDTMSQPGSMADRPPSETASCCADTTTGSSTKEPGRFVSPTTACRSSFRPTG
ncbi:DUF222 domain-containing protein [Actinopolymorpha sp. B17G11]|uniref:DUF222 domain-containing protein n=1 Tax=Actinopolymorpha sp. B17G11 TaxID=3160861 RepID=UPI0032E3790F